MLDDAWCTAIAANSFPARVPEGHLGAEVEAAAVLASSPPGAPVLFANSHGLSHILSGSSRTNVHVIAPYAISSAHTLLPHT